MKNYQLIMKDSIMWIEFEPQISGIHQFSPKVAMFPSRDLKSETSVSGLCVGGDVDY